MDLYNRDIVAYTISDCQDTDFVLETLNQLELSQGAVLHSDQGSVYTSDEEIGTSLVQLFQSAFLAPSRFCFSYQNDEIETFPKEQWVVTSQ
ncbi:hypothetical protein ACVV62_07245 [Streptococcus pluranimalium]